MLSARHIAATIILLAGLSAEAALGQDADQRVNRWIASVNDINRLIAEQQDRIAELEGTLLEVAQALNNLRLENAILRGELKECQEGQGPAPSVHFGYWNKPGVQLSQVIDQRPEVHVVDWVGGMSWRQPSPNQHRLDPERWRGRLVAQAAKGVDSPYMILDVEGPAQAALKDPSHPDHAAVLQDFIDGAQIAREVFPDRLIGYYGIPTWSFWAHLSTPQEQAEMRAHEAGVVAALEPFVDVWIPTIYDPYADEDVNESVRAEGYKTVATRCEIALEFGGGKPVIPIAWRLWHDSNATRGYEGIYGWEFDAQLAAAFEAEANGRRISGFHLWNRQRVNWDEDGAPTRNVPVAEMPAWLNHTEADSFNRVVTRFGLAPIPVPVAPPSAEHLGDQP